MDLLIEKLLSEKQNFRYERKFYIPERMPEKINCLLRFHPAYFKEIYYKRSINNIYLDTYDLRCYRDNVNGSEKRIKIRIRWYGNLMGLIQNPYLEIKVKKACSGFKLRYPLDDFELGEKFSLQILHSLWKRSNIPQFLCFHLKNLTITLLNKYDRRYYLTFNRQYRMTLDTQMEFYSLDTGGNNCLAKVRAYHHKILELKYDFKHEADAHFITNQIPFRVSRHSKYVWGMEKLVL